MRSFFGYLKNKFFRQRSIEYKVIWWTFSLTDYAIIILLKQCVVITNAILYNVSLIVYCYCIFGIQDFGFWGGYCLDYWNPSFSFLFLRMLVLQGEGGEIALLHILVTVPHSWYCMIISYCDRHWSLCYACINIAASKYILLWERSQPTVFQSWMHMNRCIVHHSIRHHSVEGTVLPSPM